MPDNRIKSRLFLLQHTFSRRAASIACFALLFFYSCRCHHFLAGKIQLLPGCQYLLKLLLIRLPVIFRSAERFLHIPGTRFSAVFVIAICPECQPHRLNVIKNLLRRNALSNFNAKLRIVSQAACTVHIKCSVRTSRKSQIAVGRVRHIRR